MRVNIIKSYCAYMFRALKILLLLFLVFQVVMMPVSQAFAARHMHDAFHEKMMASVFLSSGMVTKSHHFVESNRKDGLSDMTHPAFRSQETYFQNSQCGKRNGHKGGCDICQCTPIVAAPVLIQVASILTSTKSYNIKLDCPLYSIVMPPPFRPPTS